MNRVQRVRGGGEQGSALAIALTFLMIFGALIGVVLQFAATGQRITLSVRDDATNTYAGGGSLDGAINMLSQAANINQGLGGATCATFTLPALALDNTSDVVVSCTPLPASGVAGGTTPGSTTAAAPAPPLTGAVIVTTGPDQWANPTFATTAGSGSATTPSLSGTGRETTTFRIGPFAADPVIPPLATINWVKVVLTGTATRGLVSAVLRTSDATPLVSSAVTYPCSSPCTFTALDSAAITAAGGQPLTRSQVNGASLDFTFSKDTNGNASGTVDLLKLSINYSIPNNPTPRKVLLEATDAGGTTLAKSQVWFSSASDPTVNGSVPTVKQWVVN